MLIHPSGRFQGLGDRWEAAIKQQFDRDHENYVSPTAEQCRQLRDAVELTRGGHLEEARQTAGQVGYRVDQIELEGEKFWLLEEAGPERGWGKVLLRQRPASHWIVEVPHPVADKSTPELGLRAFQELDAQAYILAGAHRNNRHDPSPDVAGRPISDMTHTRQTAFQAFHEGLTEPGQNVLQLHGFSAWKGHQEAPDFPLSRQVVLSDGADDDRDPPRLKALHQSLVDQGFDTSIVTFDSPGNSRLSAVTNVQRDQMEAAHLVPRSEFIHLEAETKLRTGEAREQNFERLLRGLKQALD
ncbi:MAG: hypothetical protein AB7S38_05820 [Vulcanimicrobiota bacterium]